MTHDPTRRHLVAAAALAWASSLTGTEAQSKWQNEEAIKAAHEPKELFWIEGATHVDLYDKPQFVTPAAARLTEFFRATLGVRSRAQAASRA